jgi:hypothetical protein
VRVNGDPPAGRPLARACAPFAEALARARRAHDHVDRGRAREAAEARRAGLDRESAALAGRADPKASARAAGPDSAEVARVGAPPPGESVARRSEDAAVRAAGAAGAAEPALDYAPEVRSPELRAILRAVPVAVEAGRVGDGAPALELAFGRALSVELRAAARGGVDLVLRPDAALARSACAELPALLRALRARGVDVGRAEVRARAGTRGGRAR